MNVLNLDSSTKIFSIAVSKDKEILSTCSLRLEKALSVSIIPMIDSVLKKANFSLENIDGFAVGVGPGSFTSLRVGLSTVKAFGMVTQKPVVGVSSLDVIAQGAKDLGSDQICVLCDARRSMVFSSVYKIRNNQLKRVSAYFLSEAKDVLKKIKGDCLFVGDGVEIFEKEIKAYFKGKNNIVFGDEKNNYAKADDLAVLSFERFKSKKIDNINTLTPMYLYPKDCQVRR
ncbi:MAG: tRNA (adenosine(37)-N6)-threonylcarbamoyltransferase complex dimerization subunit type 1 TsaB [Candidatus Omnitrophica bacterium]|nr:tRNA (adenosine(37)-N6)-threonylcarbamoyltransferase complex dimerization subunit type 1 TsaB [Candidatus Omnitrophota bacterium]